MLTSRTEFPAPPRPGMAMRPAAAAAAAADGMARGARAPCTLGTDRPAEGEAVTREQQCPRPGRGSAVLPILMQRTSWRHGIPPAAAGRCLRPPHRPRRVRAVCMRPAAQKLRLRRRRAQPGSHGRACMQVPVTMQTPRRAGHGRLPRSGRPALLRLARGARPAHAALLTRPLKPAC